MSLLLIRRLIMSARLTARPYERLSEKWRALAERRRSHFVDLYNSGRWKHYYTEEEFVRQLRDVFAAADVWAKLAPRTEGEQAA
ncbi:MAG: hypothetical protein QOJ96_340 [Alphaproteobacteria bacterium]|jgi:uncharacterized repeat protein (TIGR03809 family)|nr:hypothetical protein [Alphaproteobacteria bacterium]